MKLLLRISCAVVLFAIVAGAIFYWNPLWVNDQHIRFHLWRAHVRSEYVYAGGYHIHYFEAEPPDGSAGIPLLLVHGLGSRAEDWSPMIPTLAAEGFHVYAPDLLGYGRSPKPDVAYSVALEEGVVVEFMRAVGLQRTDVDGWSMGGWIAAKIALEHPAMVNRLVLDDSAGLKYQFNFPKTAFVPTDKASLDQLIALLTPKPPAMPGFVVRASLQEAKREGKIVQQCMDSMTSGSDLLDGRLDNITQPTLIVWGTEDKVIPVSIGERMHREIPNSVLDSIAGCGHLAPRECAKPVLAGTIQFLKAQPALQGGEQMLPGTTR
jgi:pimeloyl-ACP methyl ester carboxylesterase